MTDQIDDGGPAFPTKGGMLFYIPAGSEAEIKSAVDAIRKEYDGLSVRDWFAGQALVAKRPTPTVGDHDRWFGRRVNVSAAESVAAQCYEIADAMLAARKVRHD